MRNYWLASILVGTLLLAGCGGSEDSIGKAEFVKRANAICAGAKKRLFAVAKAKLKELGREYDNVAVVESALIPTLEGEAEEIRALGAPSGDEGEIDAILAEIEAVVAESKQDPAAIGSAAFPYKKIEDLANEYGLSSCPLD